MGARFFMCGSVIREERIVTVASFLNNDSPLFNLSFKGGRICGNMKSGGRRIDRRNLSLSVSKVQNDRGYDILKRSGMTQNIENRFSLLLVTNEILTDSFEVMGKEEVLSK